MSENIPESVPTSQDPRSKRPTKRRALSPNGQQAKDVEALFANPDKAIVFPDSSAERPRTLPPPPEIVQNVQGSSAGAGSGEFHVYKASRRREYERLRLMEEEGKKEKDDADYENRKDERQRKDDEKTRKNREKREKAKKRKAKGNTTDIAGGVTKNPSDSNELKNGPRAIATSKETSEHEDAQDEAERSTTVNGTTTISDEVGITIHEDD